LWIRKPNWKNGATEPINIDFTSDPEHAKIKNEIATLEADVYTEPNDTDLKYRKQEIISRIDEIKSQLSIKDQAERQRARVKELEKELREKSQQLADLEKQEFVADDFTNTKMNLVEARVNKMFSLVQFKMFEKLINGGIEPACTTLLGGVPWMDANNAARINGGLDIINTLSKYHNVSAPIFIDNSESVVKLIGGDFQLIKLIVSEKHSKLTVSAPNVPKSAELFSVSV
jgi:DNA repair protein SbcC/Rad50